MEKYHIASNGSKTKNGGTVVGASTEMFKHGLCIACVGDSVEYPDGSSSKIMNGAGAALQFNNKPIAIVGSKLENGDVIVLSPLEQLPRPILICIKRGEAKPEGFLAE